MIYRARNAGRVCLPRHVRDRQILQTFHVQMSLRFASTVVISMAETFLESAAKHYKGTICVSF